MHPIADNDKLDGPARRVMTEIAKVWSLNATELAGLLGTHEFTHATEEREAPLPPKVLERISYVLGVYKAIHTLLPDRSRADEWIRQPNTAPIFGGRSALELMASGDLDDLAAVRRYLDAQIA